MLLGHPLDNSRHFTANADNSSTQGCENPAHMHPGCHAHPALCSVE